MMIILRGGVGHKRIRGIVMEEIHVEDFNDYDDERIEEAARERLEKAKKQSEIPSEKKSLFKEIMSWVLPFAAAILAALFIKNYLIINADVPTGSMENTIMPGDRFVGNRLAYIKSGANRGDIVVFRYPDNEKEIYVKRVIGLPGETVVIDNGKIYIDGSTEPLEEDYLKEEWTVATGPYTFEVPEDSYFVMGDNRNDSWDARYWTNTYVTKDKILGKALFVYWPFSDFGKLE